MAIASSMNPNGRTLEIRVVGRFDFAEHRAFRDAYKSLAPGECQVVVDLSQTDYMDSSALGMLLVLRQHMGGNAADIVLRGAQKGVQQVLAVARFSDMFKIE